MYFLEKQYICVYNVLSYRTRIKCTELSNIISFIYSNLDVMGLESIGKFIFNISEVIDLKNEQIYGIEILVPVNKPFESTGQCVYKPIFRIENAVSRQTVGGYDNILDVESSIFSYIKRRNLSPVTGVYHVVLHNDLPLENLISYVGTNSNIL